MGTFYFLQRHEKQDVPFFPLFANPTGAQMPFQVNTIVVDAKSGRLVAQYRHLTSGLGDAAPLPCMRTSPGTAEKK